MAEETEVADPRLVALGLASDLVVEFPPGMVEFDILAREGPLPALAVLADEPPPAVDIERVDATALAASEVLLRVPVEVGRFPRGAELAVEDLGLRFAGPPGIFLRWDEVMGVDVHRGRVRVRAGATTTDLLLSVDGVGEPELSAPFVRVLREARDGRLDLEGTAAHDLQNATDSLRDRFHEGDDAFIPVALGLLAVGAAAAVVFALPPLLALLTRPAASGDAFLLVSYLSSLDPRVLLAAVSAGATLAAIAAGAALGAHAGLWARGTLRGWHREGPEAVRRMRRGLALAIRFPRLAAAGFAVALLLALPSARYQAMVDRHGVHVFRQLPAFDGEVSWGEVTDVARVPAAGAAHRDGFAVLIRSGRDVVVNTADLAVQNASDRYFYDLVTTWRAR